MPSGQSSESSTPFPSSFDTSERRDHEDTSNRAYRQYLRTPSVSIYSVRVVPSLPAVLLLRFSPLSRLFVSRTALKHGWRPSCTTCCTGGGSLRGIEVSQGEAREEGNETYRDGSKGEQSRPARALRGTRHRDREQQPYQT